MPENRSEKARFALVAFLSGAIVTGAVVAAVRYTPSQDICITNEYRSEWESTVCVGGAVNLPGCYPCRSEDSLASLIEAAGGIADNVSAVKSFLFLDFSDAGEQPQKIDINRAGLWLLKALPGIGDTLASRIIEYRCENGPFMSTHELIRVEGIGDTLFAAIEPYITVTDRH